MEQLWNRAGATAGKRSALRRRENGLIWGETFATGCHRLPFGSHGKEGVSGSSPEEGFNLRGSLRRIGGSFGSLFHACWDDVRQILDGRR
jgi:hypothetical protein